MRKKSSRLKKIGGQVNTRSGESASQPKGHNLRKRAKVRGKPSRHDAIVNDSNRSRRRAHSKESEQARDRLSPQPRQSDQGRVLTPSNEQAFEQKVFYREVVSDYEGQRLDNHLMTFLKGVPKSKLYQIIRKGELRVNGKRIKPDYRLQSGDKIRIPPLRRSSPIEKPLPSQAYLNSKVSLEKNILFENKSLLVMNKPAGLAVHGGSKTPWGIIEALRVLRDDIHFLELVHRLDRDTSGVLLFAKKRSVLRALHRAIADRRLGKRYTALVVGRLAKPEITVNMPLDKNNYQGGERVVRVSREGKLAVTRFKVLQRFSNATLVSACIETGRTHQIRVHAQYLGHPIVGDDKYGDADFNQSFRKLHGIERMWLHAAHMQLPGDLLDALYEELNGAKFKAPLDDELIKVLQSLGYEDKS